jgi:HD superfamily phosphohydrolase YqeK
MVGLHEVEALFDQKEELLAHSMDVAREIEDIAEQFSLEPPICQLSALCHDLGGIFSPEEMMAKAVALDLPLDPAETQYPFLLHQHFSRILCSERLGISDTRILEAVGCHTTLKANPSPYDMALYIADKLAWDQPGFPPYENNVREALAVSLEAACLSHIDYVLSNGMILMPHTWLLEARNWLIPFAASS